MMKIKDSKKKIIWLITVIALITIILGSVIIRNTVMNQEAKEGNQLAGANQNSELIANNIKKGVTIGGITGTLEILDTSDATATPEDLTYGKTAYSKGDKITGIVSRMFTMTGYETQNTEVYDDLGNKIIIPAGFKIVNTGDIVEHGIVIEDISAGTNTKGSQFVWIPVGKIQTTKGEKEINLTRNDFDNSGNAIEVSNSFKEETPVEHNASGYINSIAKNIDEFKQSVTRNGGFYIGRFEAGDAYAITSVRNDQSNDSNPLVCRKGVYPYNHIGQSQASELCKKMYISDKFDSDLVNSYAWDTTIMFIQTCSEYNNYSIQKPLQSIVAKCGAATDSTGLNNDKKCNIYDMAGNMIEWTTETNFDPVNTCVYRGGTYGNTGLYVGFRGAAYGEGGNSYLSCRPILYLQ